MRSRTTDQEFNGGPVRPRIEPSLNRGQKFHRALVRSCIGATRSLRPHCAAKQGAQAREGAITYTHGGQKLNEEQISSSMGFRRSMRT